MNSNIKIVQILIFFGILIVSLVIYFSAKDFSNQGSYIEVKGLSEKIVKSDNAIWSLDFRVGSNSIDKLYSMIEKNTNTVTNFLINKGFKKDEISVAPLNVYYNSYRDAVVRYNTTVQVSVYSTKVDLVKKTSQETKSLLKSGVIMSGGYINFNFTKLNSIKPKMLEESTQKAKEAAIGFAGNSDAKIGKLVRAKQGLFSITNKDPGSPEYKKVRVISTLRYLLK